ncbi:MAG: trehalase [Candidatus Marinimicrobia bacterium]|jgi:putative isomerase|nr:trehalase [Candidatus Neomarinimicrobiota bacterium]MBT3634526.1 trehalase [Candidatus Neomarinimicrobiota bacterium]MBT3683423.1 trehalase [Candidatus Neomarinimicrobiota bacterium]MBT3760311.1 trehalase [Candidatus Neomarinimicrobiota bacterium]MBT3896406.1 trehalase [Candidatus Neomarinimicrobiota bacterium]
MFRSFSGSLFLIILALSCNSDGQNVADLPPLNLPANMLDYRGTPSSGNDRNSLVFSDQGAWFAYGLPNINSNIGGFTGPFLMTQENGVWCSKSLSQLTLQNGKTKEILDWSKFQSTSNSYNSHLEKVSENDDLIILQTLFFNSAHSAIIITEITNKTEELIKLDPYWHGSLFPGSLHFIRKNDIINLVSPKTNATGYLQPIGSEVVSFELTESSYRLELNRLIIEPKETKKILFSHSFLFPQQNFSEEQFLLDKITDNPFQYLKWRKRQKSEQITKLISKLDVSWQDSIYIDLLSKTVLTLQNNWRISAGEIPHSGLFPSYHSIWFNGFWAWDSWKHAAALAHYDTDLAKEQVRLMYAFQEQNGFIPDCVFRDTSIENHNYRNTKPPLSAWAVWTIFEQSDDVDLLDELYPQIVLQHNWWYSERDYDKDGLCEYGSTDGSLVAAKWESGMDNAVRFDNSKLLMTSENAFSLNQESVDLNAYLFAEKGYLAKMAGILNKENDVKKFRKNAELLKSKIQQQFFDDESGWYYDTNIDGTKFIKTKGCEGWIPLWAKAATDKQAAAVMQNMVNPALFNTKVPFQTLSADHPEFKPDGGYWRGPNWLDQAYFGVQGLKNYGFNLEAEKATFKLIHNAEGVLIKGMPIRENYQPITGEGLEAENFSWSAAHYLMLLIEDK